MAITLTPSLIARLGPLIGGGIMSTDPENLKGLLETFASSPLAQVLQARDDDVIDLDEEREKREAEKEKAKDIEKEGSAADQFDDIMGDLFGVRRREKKVIDFPEKDAETKANEQATKLKGELEGALKDLGLSDEEIAEKKSEAKEKQDKNKFEQKQENQRSQMLKENERMTEEVINQEFKDQNVSPIDAKKIAKNIVDGYDEGILDPQEIVNQVRSYFGLKMGGMVDKAISYGPRN
jgi:hypothetical protein